MQRYTHKVNNLHTTTEQKDTTFILHICVHIPIIVGMHNVYSGGCDGEKVQEL